jgi:hypothetical protein
MSDAQSDAPALPFEHARHLGLAVLAVMKHLGADVLELDEDDAPQLIRLARVGKRLVIAERDGDRTTSRPHRYTAYRCDEVEPGGVFKLDPASVLFVLHEQGFYSPPDWHLELIEDPRGWFNETVAAIHLALEPVAPWVN